MRHPNSDVLRCRNGWYAARVNGWMDQPVLWTRQTEWARAMSRNASGYGPYDAYDADSQPPIPGRLGRKMSGAI